MFDIELFIGGCETALADPQPMLAVKEILDRAVAEPDAVATALSAEAGVAILHLRRRPHRS